jgi:SAM-dependent methyltransferase
MIEVPADSVEREFLEYWSANLLDPRDPQNARWLGIEQGQIARGERMAAELATWVNLRGVRALEIGCQTGALAIALAKAGADTAGIDVTPTLIEAARRRARGHGVTPKLEVASAESLPFGDASFDLVTFIDVIEHIADADRALDEAVRVLRPGGTLYVQGPNRLSPRWLLRDPHYQMFGISALPPSLGRFYVTRIRRRPRYDVERFPIGPRVLRRLARSGLEVIEPRLGIGVRRVARELRLTFASMFVIVARKR